ncbi:MAG: folate-binding protein YgfZ [Hyphomicrobium sp.]|jgi:folate-binding protein YgfZ|nr:folate-binding protein YgfZ [Hyphomicrobium sp.]
MLKNFVTRLDDRGAVSVSGADAVKFLQGLVTNDVAALGLPDGSRACAAHAALLSPQGKILFDFLAARTTSGFVLDAARDKAAELAKRLAMYKLRADVVIADASNSFVTLALWGEAPVSSGETEETVSFRDPRHDGLGLRILTEARFAGDITAATNATEVPARYYHAHRIALGVPEGGKDYEFGDAYPHEADFDLFNGVSFSKGCYVGQEVVSRMQHKTVVRKRVVRISGENDLTPGTDVAVKGIVIGRTGSVDGRHGLALIRLDRYSDAINADAPVQAGETRIRIHEADVARYTTSVSTREKT